MRDSEPQKINPYAPVDSTGFKPMSAALPDGINGNLLAWNTYCFVFISGGLFGFSMVFVSGLSRSFFAGSIAMGFFAAVVGLLLAAVGAAFVVPIVYAIAKSFGASQPGYWNGFRIRMFGASCGFLTGWACVAVPNLLGGRDFSGFVMGLVPAVFGGIATTLMLHSTAKKADRIILAQQDTAVDESTSTDPLRT